MTQAYPYGQQNILSCFTQTIQVIKITSYKHINENILGVMYDDKYFKKSATNEWYCIQLLSVKLIS